MTIPLAILTPCIFMWSNNWYMYSHKSLAICLGLLLIVSAGMSAVGYYISKQLHRRSRSEYIKLTAGLIVCFFASSLLSIFLNVPLMQMADYTGLSINLIKVCLFMLMCGFVRLAGFKALNCFLGIWLLTAGLTGSYAMLTYESSLKPPVKIDVTLKNKPNIYLFYLESYQGLSTLEKLYSIDTEPIRTYLNGKNFFIYEPVLSNSPNTLSSYADTFSMQYTPAQKPGFFHNDVEPAVRNLIGGSEDNTLFKTLKKSGYRTVLLTKDDPYFFNVLGDYLDETDLNFSGGIFKPLWDINGDKFQFLRFIFFDQDEWLQFHGDLYNRIKVATKRWTNTGQPLFLCFKGGANHVPTDRLFYGALHDYEKWKPTYRHSVEAANAEMEQIVDYLISIDPDSIIILIGDHGTQGFQSLLRNQLIAGDIDALQEKMRQYGFSQELVTDVFFSVLMAIRLPGEKIDISHGLPMSHVNLFRHIFAYLNDDPAILNDRVPTKSINVRIILGRDNKPAFEKREETD